LVRGVIAAVLFVLFFNMHSTAQRSGGAEIFFLNDNYLLKPDNEKKLDSLLRLLKKGEACYIKIEGFTDRNGTIKDNDVLAAKRTKSVADYFAGKGIPVDSMNQETWGMRRLKYGTEEDYLNRRAEISYIIYLKKPVLAKKEPPKKEKVPDPVKTDTVIVNAVEKIADAEVGEAVAMNSVQFYPGTSQLLESAFPVLDELIETLRDNKSMEITIEGHICCVAIDDDNLSERRAKTVYSYLVEHNIDESRLEYKGFGRTRPLTDESTPEKQQQNRRVEIRIRKK
jgi:outer membrane protein OmpA-like peptidoglycan-associated protein